MKLSIQLVTWNGEKFLPALFSSLANQSFSDWDLLIFDNGSTDSSKDIIQRFATESGFAVKNIFSDKNIGFSPAHSALFRETNAEYIAVLNQDVILDSDAFEILIDFLDKDSRVAAVAPKLLRMKDGNKTTIVDSLGLRIMKTRQVVDIDSGKDLKEEVFDASPVHEVFGVSGAVAVYRSSAVKAVCKPGELFDESFVSYQEDIDLAWKLQLGGFRSAVLNTTTAYHERGIKESDDKSLGGRLNNKKNQPFIIRYNSYRNHLATIYKNEQLPNFILDFILIFWYEGMKFVYNFWFDREVLKGLNDLWQNRIELKKERLRIQGITKQNWKSLGRWWA